jgi:murein DD-endopeptidase MepM/ murein hydrolase activator NlpD
MKKIYYFSQSKLQFIEIKKFRYKLIAYVLAAVIILSLVLCGSYTFLFSITSSNSTMLKNENEILRSKLGELVNLYKVLDNELDSLVKANVDLRIAANLPVISDEVRLLGFGGGSFDNNIEFLNITNADEIKNAHGYIEELTRKIDFEKSNYTEIAINLEKNKQLYSAIPAIKPCEGTVAYHGFGKRMHPILNRIRMHEGIDIVANVGTAVYSSGKGKVVFTGYKGSYGLTVEIDHGFGYKTLYAHLSKALVKKGVNVSRGDLIAKTGNTGLSTGPHLHYEVEHNGIKHDPIQFIFNDINLFE